MDRRANFNRIKGAWYPPKELECARPREVSLTWAGRIVFGLAVALFLGGMVGGPILFTIVSRDQEGQNQIIKSSTDAEAVVTQYWTSGHDPVRYWVAYNYGVEGKVYTGRLSTEHSSWLDLQRKGTLKVRYLPEDPQRNLALGYEADRLPFWVPALGAGVLLFVGCLLMRILEMQRHLLAEGRPAQAIVTKIGRTADHGKKIVHYVFKNLGGKVIDGKSGPQRNPPAVGSILNVIYEPDQENHNRIYPLALVKTKRD
jgi:hypothetical protein